MAPDHGSRPMKRQGDGRSSRHQVPGSHGFGRAFSERLSQACGMAKGISGATMGAVSNDGSPDNRRDRVSCSQMDFN